MKKKNLIRTILILCIPWVLAHAGTGNIGEDEIQAINRAIQARGAKWKAGENKMTRIPLDELNFMRGTQPEMPDVSKMRKIRLSQIQNLPSHFDWRNNNGNWVTPVKDQQMALCSSSGIFAAFAQVESWWKIYNQQPDSMIDLSEQYLLSCGEFKCGTVYVPFTVLDFAKKNDIPTEDCLPYQASDTVLCKLVCGADGRRTVRIPDWGCVVGCENVDALKNAVYRQPVSVFSIISQDFMAYTSGVYEHTWGNPIAYHSVTIIGWDDTEACWICKNCWGEDWGENGFFRIKWGESDMGSNVPFIWSGQAETGSLAVSPAEINVTLTLGDSVETHLVLKNGGAGRLEFLARSARIPAAFHTDAFNAQDEKAWWCGDPQIKGYWNVWLQYLDMPSIDLSGAVNPVLTFLGYWAVETPGKYSDWDGYDGCNVWISTDGGKSFEVISPVSPEYNCSNLSTFGTAIWNLGDHIPGWAGKSMGWVPVTFDLSGFKSDSVVVRFAFATDFNTSTSDYLGNSSLIGFFVDEIQVSDGTDLIFENDGEYEEGFRASCVRHPTQNNQDTNPYEIGVHWLTLHGESGIIDAGDSTLIGVSIRASELEAGPTEGLIRINTNDSTQDTVDIPVRLNVRSPEHDLVLRQKHPLNSNLAFFLYNPLGVQVYNYGLKDETDFDLACTVSSQGHPVYRDTVHVPLVKAGKSTLVDFKPIRFTESVDASIQAEMMHMNFTDANPRNNNLVCPVSVTNLVDDFETNTGFFDFQGGWGVVDLFKGHSGMTTAHVNKGKNYQPGADAVMTLKQGLALDSLQNPLLQFWVECVSIKDLDQLFVEASPDSESWMKLDSLSGRVSQWTQRSVDLTPVLTATSGRYWVRFHFVSRSRMSRIGFMIDDIGLFGIYGPGNGIKPYDNTIPDEWVLDQNYPNPFNHESIIRFVAPVAAKVTLKVYDLLGREVMTVFDGQYPAGEHRVSFDASGLSSGLYFYRIRAGNFTSVRKMVLLE